MWLDHFIDRLAKDIGRIAIGVFALGIVMGIVLGIFTLVSRMSEKWLPAGPRWYKTLTMWVLIVGWLSLMFGPLFYNVWWGHLVASWLSFSCSLS